MASITQREIKASYELGIEVYNKEISIEDAVARLVDDYQMNEASASMVIHFLQHMLKEKEYKRTLSTSHVKYYANRIFEDFGVEKLKIFLKGLELHIKYRQSIGLKAPAFCDIHTEYSKKAGEPQIF